MRDKRPVDELSIEELERVLAIRKREARQQQLHRMRSSGRIVGTDPSGNGHPHSGSAAQPPKNGGEHRAPARAANQDASLIPEKTSLAERSQQMTPPQRSPDYGSAEPRFEEETDHHADSEVVTYEFVASNEVTARKRRSAVNRLLTVVEVAALLGLLVLGVVMFDSITTLQDETAEAQALANRQRLAGIPTPTSTPQLQLVRLEDYVLPGGHIIERDGSVRFNLDEFIEEVPSHLRVQIENQVAPVNVSRPQRTPTTAVRVIIPRLSLDQTIVQGTDWEALKQGVGQVLNGARPGDAAGNVVLAAHNDVYGELFRNLDQMQVDDQFQIQTEDGETYTYVVTGYERVKPTDIHVMANQGRATVTLISCYPHGVNNERYIVYADRVTAANL
jgi:sortase A